MFDSEKLFKERLSGHIKELSRYLKYIFNGHLAVVIFFSIAALAYYYQQWLAQLPENFPTALVIGGAFGLLVSYSPVRTLLKAPDLVFLIAAEHKMKPYFRRTLIYSYFSQLYMLFLAAAAFGPLYLASYPEQSGRTYLTIVGLLLLFKGANLFTNWWMLKIQDSRSRTIDQTARMLMNIAIFYFIIAGELFIAVVPTILFVIIFLYDYSLSRKASLNWELLIKKDESQMQAFYRVASMFVEVPHLRSKVKKRQWLVSLLTKNVSFANEKTYDYLYRIAFVRSGDYLGVYVRLIIIGLLFVALLPNMWFKIIFSILFLYLSLFQMMPLYRHHRTMVWLDLYPVEPADQKRAFIKWMHQLGWFQLIIFAVFALIVADLAVFALVSIGGAIFNMLFIRFYIKKKIT